MKDTIPFLTTEQADYILIQQEKALAIVSNPEKRLDRVDTFIGRNDRGEYVKVGGTENLSSPGVIFRYASYVREQEALLGYYLQCYHENLKGLVYTEKGAYYTI